MRSITSIVSGNLLMGPIENLIKRFLKNLLNFSTKNILPRDLESDFTKWWFAVVLKNYFNFAKWFSCNNPVILIKLFCISPEQFILNSNSTSLVPELNRPTQFKYCVLYCTQIVASSRHLSSSLSYYLPVSWEIAYRKKGFSKITTAY